MEARSRSAQRIIFSAARIASSVERGAAPLPEELFLFAAATVGAARNGDTRALETAVGCATALLDGLPGCKTWSICRAQLQIMLQFVWLLKEIGGDDSSGELGFTNEQKGKE